MNPKWHRYFFSVVDLTAKLSVATRLKVGCVLVRDKRIILCGYNGMPAGSENESCEDDFGRTRNEVLHAEENAILYAAKKGISLQDSTLYISYSPCIHCSRMIYGAGIKEMFYRENYRLSEGLDFLEQMSIPVFQITSSL